MGGGGWCCGKRRERNRPRHLGATHKFISFSAFFAYIITNITHCSITFFK